MPSTYNTPAVYVKETNVFPPSVTAVATAIPAFIGYTEKAGIDGEYFEKPIRISSMLDYETIFGGAPEMDKIEVILDSENKVTKVTPTPKFYLYHSLRLFYANGGGSCYIVSVGKSDSTNSVSRVDLEKAIAPLEKEDEPTLVVCPDASLLDSTNYFTFTNKMIDHCAYMQDRFAIIDAFYDFDNDFFKPGSDSLKNFRNGIVTTSNLKYAAAYYPFLRSSISIPFSYDKIENINWGNHFIDGNNDHLIWEATKKVYSDIVNINSIMLTDDGAGNDITWQLAYNHAKESETTSTNITKRENVLTSLIEKVKLLNITENYNPNSSNNDVLNYYQTIWDGTSGTIDIPPSGETLDSTNILGYFNQAFSILANLNEYAKARAKVLEDLLAQNSSFFDYIRNAVRSQGLILPPSGAITGIYARVDAQRGVWKAPANEGLSMVIEPTQKLNHEEHGLLNVDSNTGKSINVIRSYVGKGTMVMGARTFKGNDSEWRYINVRRLFIFIEESIQEACENFLFEANDANTWVKVKGMINNFLYNLWREGALAGAKPEDAYYIKIGINETMTSDDILNGILKVQLGIKAAHPAEFIILDFRHQLQIS